MLSYRPADLSSVKELSAHQQLTIFLLLESLESKNITVEGVYCIAAPIVRVQGNAITLDTNLAKSASPCRERYLCIEFSEDENILFRRATNLQLKILRLWSNFLHYIL